MMATPLAEPVLAGHFLHLERADEVNERILAFPGV
jgi:hypothetical protein